MWLFATSGVPLATGVIGTDISIQWPSATRPGDILHLDITLDKIIPSSSCPDRASVIWSYQTVNQHGEIRQRTTARSIVWRRPA